MYGHVDVSFQSDVYAGNMLWQSAVRFSNDTPAMRTPVDVAQPGVAAEISRKTAYRFAPCMLRGAAAHVQQASERAAV